MLVTVVRWVVTGVRVERAEEASWAEISMLLWAGGVVACAIGAAMFLLMERKDRREILTGVAVGMGLAVFVGLLVAIRLSMAGGW